MLLSALSYHWYAIEPVPVAATVKFSPSHKVSVELKSVPKLGAVGSFNSADGVVAFEHPFVLVTLKLVYIPEDKPVIVAVPLVTLAFTLLDVP